MKKIVALLMLLIMAVSVTGCKSGKNPELQAKVEEYEANAEKAEEKKEETKDAEKEAEETEAPKQTAEAEAK